MKDDLSDLIVDALLAAMFLYMVVVSIAQLLPKHP